MDYKASSTAKLKSLNDDLKKELAELKTEIEENDLVHGIPYKPFSYAPHIFNLEFLLKL